jgi:predicted CXXCH cytochrome family protein
MKKLLALAVAAIATTASAQITGSKHDLTLGYNGSGIAAIGSCQFCHAPHYGNASTPGGAVGAPEGYIQIPLWNRNTPNTAQYSLFTAVAGGAASVALGVGSYTCLSCHDGVSDIGDTFRGTNGYAAPVVMTQVGPGATANLSGTVDGTGNWVPAGTAGWTDLRDDHPVGIAYNGTGSAYGGGGNGYAANATVTGAGLKLYARVGGGVSIECGSCHDPHNRTLSSKFLRILPSSLCGSCHLK